VKADSSLGVIFVRGAGNIPDHLFYIAAATYDDGGPALDARLKYTYNEAGFRLQVSLLDDTFIPFPMNPGIA